MAASRTILSRRRGYLLDRGLSGEALCWLMWTMVVAFSQAAQGNAADRLVDDAVSLSNDDTPMVITLTPHIADREVEPVVSDRWAHAGAMGALVGALLSGTVQLIPGLLDAGGRVSVGAELFAPKSNQKRADQTALLVVVGLTAVILPATMATLAMIVVSRELWLPALLVGASAGLAGIAGSLVSAVVVVGGLDVADIKGESNARLRSNATSVAAWAGAGLAAVGFSWLVGQALAPHAGRIALTAGHE